MRFLYLMLAALGLGQPQAGLALNLQEDASRLFVEGRYVEAREVTKRALAEAGEAKPCQLGALHHLLGSIESSLGRHIEAVRALEFGIGLCEKQEAPTPEVMVALLVALGDSYTHTAHFPEAATVLRRAMATAQAGLPPDHARAATVFEAFGLLYFSQGQTSRAEASFRRGLSILERLLGAGHPDIASRNLTLGSILASMGRVGEAVPLIERSRVALQASRGPGHPDTIFASLTLAVVRLESTPAESEALLRLALADWRATQPEQHLTTAKIWNALADAVFRQRRAQEALDYSAKALGIVRIVAGPEHRQSVQVMYNHARLLAAAKRKKEATKLRAEADRIRRERGYADPGRHIVDMRALLWR